MVYADNWADPRIHGSARVWGGWKLAKTAYQVAVDRFLEYFQHGKGRSARSVEAYRLALTRLQEYMGEADPLQANADDLVMFAGKWLFDRHVGATARRPYVAAIRTFFKWASNAGGVVRRNPALSLEYPKKSKTVPLQLTLGNAEKILHMPDLDTFMGLRDSAIMHVLIGCGIRVTALTGINEGDFINDQISGQPRVLLRVRTKGDQEEIKILPQQADLVVRMYLAHPQMQAIDRAIQGGRFDGDKVVFIQTGSTKLPKDQFIGESRRMSRQAVYAMIKKYGKRAEIPENQLHPHAMRHLFGTELVEDDVNLARVQRAMGHSDPKSTAIYLHMAQAKMAKEIDRANPLAKISTPISQFLDRLNKPGK